MTDEAFSQGGARSIREAGRYAEGVCSRKAEVEEQKNAAREHDVNPGRCFAFTRRARGYACRRGLTAWVHERDSQTRGCVVGKPVRPAASWAPGQAAVHDLCTRLEGHMNPFAIRYEARLTPPYDGDILKPLPTERRAALTASHTKNLTVPLGPAVMRSGRSQSAG